MFRYLTPAGNKISIQAIFRALIMMRRKDIVNIFEEKLKQYLQVKHCFLTSSGTASLYLALISLKELSDKHEVIMPAYTCPSVLATVIKAGLKPVLCDLDEESSIFKYTELKTKISNHTLTIISVHLFGILENSFKINKLKSSHNVFHIEDAAQSFGTKTSNPTETTVPQTKPGTTGDIGIYSFGRGKPITLMQGGALTTNSDAIAKAISQKLNELGHQSATETFKIILDALSYSLFFHPRLYWIPQSLPFLKLGETIFNLDFKIKQIDSFTSALGTVMIENISKINMIRIEIEKSIFSKLSDFRNYFLTNVKNSSHLLRFPLLLKNKEQKESVLSQLKFRCLGATGMYPSPLNLLKDTKKYFTSHEQFKNAQSFSERILTLPLHEYVTEKDIAKIRNTIENIITNSNNPITQVTQ